MNSIFYDDITEHLALREKVLAPGSFAQDRRVLMSFDRHLAERGKTERCITEEDVVSWIQPLYDSLSRYAVANKVGFLRMFLKYLRYKGISVYLPPYPAVPDTYVPYLFSDTELEKIFAAADTVSVSENSGERSLKIEFPMLLRMLYSCGFRLGELLSAKVGDVNFKRGVILLRDTKNRKQRVVPLGDALTEMLQRYCLAMGLMGSPDNFLFPARDRKKHLSQYSVDDWFRDLLKQTGIYVRPEKHTRGQCLHCFRHLFTVKSFAQAERAGRPVNDSIPFLSVYLGHFDMDATEKYLKFSSDIFPEHTILFEAFTEGVFPEVCYED